MTTCITRRRALRLGALALPLVHVRSGHAAGKLALAFWDHWVPGRQRRDDSADQHLGEEEPGRGHHRLYERRQQAGDHCRGRGAGEDWSRCDGDGRVGGAKPCALPGARR